MNLMYDLINKFGSANIGVDRENNTLKVSNVNFLVIIDFIRPDYDDIVNMIVVDDMDSVILYCNPDFKIGV